MANIILLRTHPENLKRVVEVQKHALKGQLTRAQPGDLLLLAEMRTSGPALATHAMWFRNQRLAKPGETEMLWGKSWRYVIEGEDCRTLDNPFSPQEAKVSSENYGRGGGVVYLAVEDADEFCRRGLLRPLL